MENKMDQLEFVLNGLMSRYKERVPDVQKVIHAMKQEGIIADDAGIENDHIAFRTMGVKNLGIQSLEKIFLHYGYKRMGHYHFEQKKLDAYWYAPPSENFPRIFISELKVNDLSPAAQAIIKKYTDEVKSDPVASLNLGSPEAVDLFLHSSLWGTPTYKDFSDLLQESEYAAWVIYNRYYLNHFTVSIHNLKEGYNTIEAFNNFLERSGLVLNDSGGKIKQSGDGLLLQSSTVAAMIPAVFADGDEHLIAGSYVEFAERKVLPQFQGLVQGKIDREHRREGFETGNADKIFESTYTSQTNKN